MKRDYLFPLVLLCGLTACESDRHERDLSREAIIAAAQAKSEQGSNPSWFRLTEKRHLFKDVRNRAYGYCLVEGQINPKCSSIQDEAVAAAVFALNIAAAQAGMTNKETLGLKERWVANNPEIVGRVTKECWALYEEHGAADARILSVCLGNLTDYTPLIPLPVP